MPQIIPNGYAAVIHSFLLAGDPDPMALTYGIGLDAGDVGAMQGIVDALRDQFLAYMGDAIPTGYTMTQTELRTGTSVIGDFGVFVNVQSAAMNGTAGPLPQNCAYLVHKRSTLSGRQHRGRLYLPGPAEAGVDPTGRVADATRTAINNMCSTWLTQLNAIGGVTSMVILHTQAPGAPAPPAPTPVVSLNVDPVIATQRRRLRK